MPRSASEPGDIEAGSSGSSSADFSKIEEPSREAFSDDNVLGLLRCNFDLYEEMDERDHGGLFAEGDSEADTDGRGDDGGDENSPVWVASGNECSFRGFAIVSDLRSTKSIVQTPTKGVFCSEDCKYRIVYISSEV